LEFEEGPFRGEACRIESCPRWMRKDSARTLAKNRHGLLSRSTAPLAARSTPLRTAKRSVSSSTAALLPTTTHHQGGPDTGGCRPMDSRLPRRKVSGCAGNATEQVIKGG
jgi:hypothetical protein